MDARFHSPAGCFTLRAAALILRDGCALLARSDDHDCFYTVGGAVRQNESTDCAIQRECLEETGCRYAIDRLVFVQERFYSPHGTPHHEITFFYLMKPDGPAPVDGAATDQRRERLHWIPLKELTALNIVPAFLRERLLDLPETATHLITRE